MTYSRAKSNVDVAFAEIMYCCEKKKQSDCVRNEKNVETVDDSDRFVVNILVVDIFVVDIQLIIVDVH